MDTQSINSVNGTAPAPPAQGPSLPQAVDKSAQPAAALAPGKETSAATASESDVRTRDPRSLQFQVDKGTNQVVTKIVDDNNKIVLMQIPSEEMLRIAKAIDRMQGFLLEGKA